MEGAIQFRTISDRLSEAARSAFVGREQELALLTGAIQSDDPPFVVAFIHGPGGIGKSSLIHALSDSLGSAVQQYLMDCRNIEPTPEGFLLSLADAFGMKETPDHNSIVNHLRETNQKTVLALDTYEAFGLMDTWLRQEFVPSLTENVFTIISGREPPSVGWLITPGWRDLFCDIEIRELSTNHSHKMLESRGLDFRHSETVQHFARGYPLVLEMAAAAFRAKPDLQIQDGPPPNVLQQLTGAFLSGLSPDTVKAVEAASTIRRVTEPMLRAVLNSSRVRDVFVDMQSLPFIDATAEGLNVHDVVHDTISKDLAWRDRERYLTYRKRAWSFLTNESAHAVGHHLWQCTADMLYLIESPVVRGAFFPRGSTGYIVEPATIADGAGICDIAISTEPEEAARLIGLWWERHPEAFHVARTRDNEIAAFYIIFEPSNVDSRLLADDPMTAAWSSHLEENPIAEGERALFLRRWLARGTGEAPSPAQGACWLDIKRTYMQLRPSLRRLYTTVIDLEAWAPIIIPLGFTPIEKAQAVVGDTTYYTGGVDFGPSSVDGWIASVVGAELGIEIAQAEESITDGSRQLVTVLFTDIVGSTEKAVEIGDALWRDTVERHYGIIREELSRFQGRQIDAAGDGVFAVFESPGDGIRCAIAISRSVHQLGLDIRAGLHLGECEKIGESVRGIAVHIGARVAAKAEASEILVSSTIADASLGLGFRFKDRGIHSLKGIPGNWRLSAVETDTIAEPER